jgi:hypothetical protein
MPIQQGRLESKNSVPRDGQRAQTLIQQKRGTVVAEIRFGHFFRFHTPQNADFPLL